MLGLEFYGSALNAHGIVQLYISQITTFTGLVVLWIVQRFGGGFGVEEGGVWMDSNGRVGIALEYGNPDQAGFPYGDFKCRVILLSLALPVS